MYQLTEPAVVEVNLMIKDWRGREITVGSTVLYPSDSGPGIGMVEGVVKKITTRQPWSWEATDKPVTKVTVDPKRRSRGHTWPTSSYVTISVLENLTVVD